MRALRSAMFLAVAGLLAPAVEAASRPFYWGEPGDLVGVAVEVDGAQAALYPAPDGSDRRYLEARTGARYAVCLTNRTGERLGVVLSVDGLNAISGERESARMYVLEPWDSTTVRGWRTSLDEVRQFTFVDERASYAARSGKANPKMGWIEVAVYRERRAWARRRFEGAEVREDKERAGEAPARPEARDRGADAGAAAAPKAAPAPPATAAPAPPAAAADEARGHVLAPREESYPGTGWGRRTWDRAEVVAFDPQAYPAERVTLRYEYASGLRALGIFPGPWTRDRLRERDGGFARPPIW